MGDDDGATRRLEHGADWVINSDADEFWWPCASSLKEALDAVPSRYGVVYATMCYFLPRPASCPFSESMTVRLLQPTPINSPPSRYRPSVKAVHRGTADVRVRRGNHEVERAGARLRSWHPLEVLHYPDRSPDQFARKYANTIDSWPTGGRAPGAFVLAAHASAERDAEQAFHERAITDDALSEALAAGAVVIDSRLRDALRRLLPSRGLPAAIWVRKGWWPSHLRTADGSCHFMRCRGSRAAFACTEMSTTWSFESGLSKTEQGAG